MIYEAENCLHVQKALLVALVGEGGGPKRVRRGTTKSALASMP